jgi:diguanylate cyclase (GGDEF)-like protein
MYKMETEISQLDQLTGLLTRKSFEEQFKVAMSQARHAEASLSLAFLDIDAFKSYNDKYGHTIGDEIISSVAKTIKATAGEGSVVGRYGGDEFALLFPNTEREQAFLALEQMRVMVGQTRAFGNPADPIQLCIQVSGGLASFPIDGRTEYELLRSADQAIYRAKVTGRNKIRLAQEEKMVPKTSHYTQTQLERLAKLAQGEGVGEAVLLREALDDLLIKYDVSIIER